MKHIIIICLAIIGMVSVNSCRTTKHISKAIAPKKDTTVNVVPNITSAADSLKMIQETMVGLQKHYIDYKSFNAKIKVDWEDSKGRQPDLSAVVRIMKDSAIWISISATILNLEAYRMLITKDSVILMNIREKEVQYRSLDYLQDVTEIPFDYKTIQDLLVGNPIFMDSTIVAYKKSDDRILISTVGT